MNKAEYKFLLEENKRLIEENDKLKDDSGEAMLERLKGLADKCGIKNWSPEYQVFMQRMFMDVAGRESQMADKYAKIAFLKDVDEEVMERFRLFVQNSNIITKKLEKKK